MQEIWDITDAHYRRWHREKKEKVMDLFALATVTANRIIAGLNGKSTESDLLQPWQLYPNLFEDRSEEIEEQRELIETERLKAQMNRRVAAWNKRFEEEHKNGSGSAEK